MSHSGSLRVGIAGFGIAGEVFHAPLVSATDGLEVAAVVTRDWGRRERARERYPGVTVTDGVEDVLGVIDLLVIASPNRFHVDNALAAIAEGVPVVIDKPLAPTVAGAERVLEAGGRVTVFQNRRWDGDFLTIRKLIERGAMGKVTRFDSSFERFRPVIGENWRESGDPTDGGGQLADLGPHLIDQAIELFGQPTTVYAELDRRRPGVQAEDDVFIALTHECGVRSHLRMGKVAPLHGPRFRVSGLGGGISIDGLDPQEDQLKRGMLPGDAGYGERAPGRLVTTDGAHDELTLQRGAYDAFYAGVAEWLLEDGQLPVDPADSLRVLRVIEAARESASDETVIGFEG